MGERPTHGGHSCLVLGYDRTDSARIAATWAAGQLRPEGRLVIVHASRGLHVPSASPSSTAERRELGRALIDELLLEQADPRTDIEVEAYVSEHDPVTALTEAAERHGATAIVVGHEQHSAARRAVGTVTTALLGASPVPVIVVPPQAAGASGPSARSGGPA